VATKPHQERVAIGKSSTQAEVAVIGGSGFYSLSAGAREIHVETPYGPPSDSIRLSEIGGRQVAFLARHGRNHEFPAHRIPHRANLWALASLGVRRVLAPCAVGSLRDEVAPGDFVLCDQFVDRTSGRADTFFDGPEVVHISTAEPYCAELRATAWEAMQTEQLQGQQQGTVVVVQGPRFGTRAESRWFASCGWDVVNMTQYPEVALARELGMCYLNISLVTDRDARREDGGPAAEASDVLAVLAANVDRVRGLIAALVPRISTDAACECASGLHKARV
jgi:5'-methylthioadenosine phosphorylase